MTKAKMFRSAILAGIAIGIGGFGNLALGGIAGAVFFAFGLITVVRYKMKLYTGVVGFVQSWSEIPDTFLVLLGNIVGCLLVGLLARLSPMDLQGTAQKLLEGRLANGALRSGALAIGCGFIVTTSVFWGRQEKWLPLLLGIPLFILCGFPHCIADAFYYLTVPFSFLGEHLWEVLGLYACLVIGNFIGCNLYRLVMWEK
ncbi:MAG: formate/nitrite transporter family protein [Bacteroidales bacterium]|nr:formate/nitrite transporter family protein [Bacteroidales bacterium]